MDNKQYYKRSQHRHCQFQRIGVWNNAVCLQTFETQKEHRLTKSVTNKRVSTATSWY